MKNHHLQPEEVVTVLIKEESPDLPGDLGCVPAAPPRCPEPQSSERAPQAFAQHTPHILPKAAPINAAKLQPRGDTVSLHPSQW